MPLRFRSSLDAALIAVPLLLAAFPADAATVKIVDGDFAQAGWTTTALDDADLDQIEITMEPVGGDPGAFQKTVTLPREGVFYFLRVKTGTVYTPSQQGAITSLDWNFDLIDLAHAQKGWAGNYNLALLQNGVLFEDIGRGAGLGAEHPEWTDDDPALARKQNHFVNEAETGPRHPDFSGSGGPIQFGYVFRANQKGGTSGLDNFEVVLHTSGGGGGALANLKGSWDKKLVIQTKTVRGKTQVTLEALNVTNEGDARAGGKSKKQRPKVAFFLSDDAILGNNDLAVGGVTIDSLKPSQSKRYVLKFNLPSGVDLSKATGKFLIAVLDSKKKVPESNEGDNQAVSPPIP